MIGVAHGIALHCGQLQATLNPQSVRPLRLRCDMGYCDDDDWLVNEQIEDALHSMREEWEDSPPIHLYDWIQVAHPKVFKQIGRAHA